MLTLTENARSLIKTITDQAEDDEVTGLRISPESSTSPELAIAAAVEPEVSDQVIEEHGACVYLEQSAATSLGDKMLDAEVDSSGAVQFSLLEQPETTA